MAKTSRKAREAREPETPVGPTLVTVKLRLTLNTVKNLRVEALGRDVSLSALVAELFADAPRRFVLHERAQVPKAQGEKPTVTPLSLVDTLDQAG